MVKDNITVYTKMNVPFYFKDREYKLLGKKIFAELERLYSLNLMDHQLQDYVDEFCSNFAHYSQCKYGIGLDSGTGALQLALMSLLEKGSEVIVPAYTSISTIQAILGAGMIPNFCDVKKDDCLIDIDKCEITKNTKAIMPVHLYGKICDMEKIMTLAKENDLKVIEDACQAHGATLNGQKAGSFGDVGSFSFYSAKNLGGFGNGGICVTNDSDIIRKINVLRDPSLNCVDVKRTPSYLDPIQAGILKVKLNYIDKFNDRRKKIARIYDGHIRNEGIVKPEISEGSVYYCYTIRVKDREEFVTKMKNEGIYCNTDYSYACHMHPVCSELEYKEGDFPVAEKISKESVNVPISAYMSKEEVGFVIENLL